MRGGSAGTLQRRLRDTVAHMVDRLTPRFREACGDPGNRGVAIATAAARRARKPNRR